MELIAEEYKQTEVGLIPVDWEYGALRKYLSFISYGFTNPMPTTLDGVFMITANDINGGRIKFETARKTSDNAFHSLLTDKSRPKRNDILLTKDGSLGRLAVVENEKICINQSVAVLRPNEKINPLFLKLLLESSFYQKTMIENAGGSTIKHIYITVVDKMKIVVPPTIAEQTAIATALSAADALISSLEKLIAKKRNIKQGAMQKLLEPKEGWEVKKLGKVAPLQRGFDLPNRDLFKGIYPVVYSNGIVNYHHKFQAKAPGIVTGRSGTIGKVNLIQEDYWPHNTTLWVTNFMGNYPLFIYFLFLKVGLERFATGSGVPTLNRNDVHDFAVSIPDYDVQVSIANILSDMDAEINALETKLEKYRNVKLGMMQNLLTGKIRLV